VSSKIKIFSFFHKELKLLDMILIINMKFNQIVRLVVCGGSVTSAKTIFLKSRIAAKIPLEVKRRKVKQVLS